MRNAASIFIFMSVLALSSCSFGTDFFVINKSPQPIIVKYKIKKEWINVSNPLPSMPKPEIISIKDLDNGRPHELTSEQYKVHIETRTITVTVQPNEALRIETARDYFEHSKENAPWFIIEDISIFGSNGEMHFSDEQARLAFVKNKKYFSLTYR